jgi:hypothetical protein
VADLVDNVCSQPMACPGGHHHDANGIPASDASTVL